MPQPRNTERNRWNLRWLRMGDVEYWIRDSYIPLLNDKQVENMALFLKTVSEYDAIYYTLDEYDEDEHNWKDFRNAIMDRLSEEIQSMLDMIVEIWKDET